ncbi:hypothetical protein Tco_1386833, partial [Tanacetum coccineum]
IDIFAFIHNPDPTKVRVVEREQNENELRLLDTTIGRTISLLLVAPDCAESELEASVERLFDEGGSGNQTEQGDSAPRRQGKKKSVVVDAGGASHPTKKLREDHGTPSGASIGGKSRSTIKRLLAGAVLNAEVEVAAIPFLPFMTASLCSTPEHEDGDHTDSMAEPNLRTIGASQRFVIYSDSSHHSSPTIVEAKVDSLVRSSAPIMMTVTTITSTVDPALVAKEKHVKPSIDFLVGGICTVIDLDADLQKVYVPQWSVTNRSRLDDSRICREMVDEFAPPNFFTSVRNVKERRRLKSVVEKQDGLLKARDGEIEDLKAQLLLKETEAAEATRLRARTSNLEAVEKSLRDEVNALKERNTILEKEQNALDVKVIGLEASVVGKERDLTDLNAQLTSVKS